MIYAVTLALHIVAACVTGAVLAYTLYVTARTKADMYRACALVLGGVAAFEVFSGTVLALVSPDISAMSLSLHIAEYLGVCAAVEVLLFVRMQKISLTFPTVMTLSPVLASTLLFVATVSFGF